MRPHRTQHSEDALNRAGGQASTAQQRRVDIDVSCFPDRKYGLLRARRSRQELKEFFKDPTGSAKRSTDTENELDPGASSGSSSKLEPPESLTLKFDSFGSSSFALDDSFSRYLTSSIGPEPARKLPIESKKPVEESKRTPEASRQAPETSNRTSMFLMDSMKLPWDVDSTPPVIEVKKEQTKHVSIDYVLPGFLESNI